MDSEENLIYFFSMLLFDPQPHLWFSDFFRRAGSVKTEY